MPSVALCISYRGNKEKNIEDIHEFVLTLPTMEYHNKTWTWLEFLTQVRRDVFFAVLSHTGQLVKEKLFSSRRPLPQVPHHLSPHALPTLSIVPSTPNDNPMGFGHFPLYDSSRATLMPGPPTASRSRHARSASEGGKGGDTSGIKSSPSTTSLESSSSAVTSPNLGKRKSQKSPKNKLFGGLMGKKSGSNTDLSEEELKRKMLFG
ncbi:golgi-body localization protein domain-domain-containing protein [Catenaria anguillulae PL171]|uniref:Golgi-body localization protein domain-domain-containing protein n=1 Tax=Catenaria anguillulae PL171 TaxID=765915 RepID=A0A1Y2HJ22_9FUNG|nr:golgi-body localization protein domain-domain-containing protein [Catenaria anguillulae PL171]